MKSIKIEKGICEGCGCKADLRILRKGELEYEFCFFCADSHVANAIMYPSTSVTNRQVLQTVARSHNKIMSKLDLLINEEK